MQQDRVYVTTITGMFRFYCYNHLGLLVQSNSKTALKRRRKNWPKGNYPIDMN